MLEESLEMPSKVKAYVPPKADDRYLELVEEGSGSVIRLPKAIAKKSSARKYNLSMFGNGKKSKK